MRRKRDTLTDKCRCGVPCKRNVIHNWCWCCVPNWRWPDVPNDRRRRDVPNDRCRSNVRHCGSWYDVLLVRCTPSLAQEQSRTLLVRKTHPSAQEQRKTLWELVRCAPRRAQKQLRSGWRPTLLFVFSCAVLRVSVTRLYMSEKLCAVSASLGGTPTHGAVTKQPGPRDRDTPHKEEEKSCEAGGTGTTSTPSPLFQP